jgi:hypothetical protein
MPTQTKNAAWTIKTLWIGAELGPLEQLCIRSFLHHGHRVELFVYDEVKNIPQGTVVRSGEDILSKANIFMYKRRPSFAAFANWFRYEMLFQEGGVWVDTDVICLKPFGFKEELFLGWEQHDKVNNAVIGALPGQAILRHMARQCEDPNNFLPYDSAKEKRRKLLRRYLNGNQRGDLKWGETGPVGLTKALDHFTLTGAAFSVNTFYPIHPTCWNSFFEATAIQPDKHLPDSYAIHVWNEMLRLDPTFSINAEFPESSLFEKLKSCYMNDAK